MLWAIRLPRAVLAALVGAGLAVSGAALQGIFRNPLADPGLIGVSSGAALGATAAIVIGISRSACTRSRSRPSPAGSPPRWSSTGWPGAAAAPRW